MADPNSEPLNIVRWAISIAIPAIAGLGGVLIGSWLASKQQREQRKLAFIEKQLKYFYSPLLGIRNEIRMLSELRLKISRSADANWRRICKEAREAGGVEALQRVTDERRDEFMRSIEYNNRQLTESLLPSYRRMVSIFRENYYLADQQTREHFRALLEFVDLWDRWLDKSIPHEVVEDIDHGEKPLYPLYEDLETKHEELRRKLIEGRA
jgi:hypothetical protein